MIEEGIKHVCLLKYNNYYNRIFKKEEKLSDYRPYVIIQYNGNSSDYNTNFKYGDGVNVVSNAYDYNGPEPDYLIVCDNENNIESRWFILESHMVRFGKFSFTLKRDVIADNWNAIQSAPMFIEKATLTQDNPLIFNKENMTFNQIKQSETELRDETNCAWIVGYLARNATGGEYTVQADIIPDYTADSFNSWLYSSVYNGSSWFSLQSVSFVIPIQIYDSSNRQQFRGNIVVNSNNNIYFLDDTSTSFSARYIYRMSSSETSSGVKQKIKERFMNISYYSTVNQYEKLYINNLNSYNTSNFNIAKDNIGKILSTSDKTNEYYVLGGEVKDSITYYSVSTDKQGNYIKSYTDSQMQIIGFTYTTSVSTALKIKRNYYSITPTANIDQFGTFKITIPTTENRYHLKDAPYDMFILQYSNDIIMKNNTTVYGKLPKITALSIIQALSQQLGSNLFDIQLLPYCPASGFNIINNTIDISAPNEKRYTEILQGEKKVGALIWCAASSGSKVINLTIPVADKKISNETELYRLVSGNYSAAFEFSAAKNGGVSYFNIDYTYIPYSPYIHISPVFNELYGGNFKDARGLIDQGDHSISYMSDKWVEYQINNKNYLNAFNREIEHMDTLHSYDRFEGIVNAAGSAVGFGITAGVMTGNPLIGVGAGALSGLAGAADVGINEKKYKETIDFTKDNFNFNLDNVKALPNTIAKVVALTPNNKIFPILEKYTATETEITALCNKIRYNGMTVGVIGRISDYITNSWSYNGISDKGYIKGQLINLSDVSADFHLVSEIANELDKGVYTK